MEQDYTLDELLGMLQSDCSDAARGTWCANHDTCKECHDDLANAIRRKVADEWQRGFDEGFASADEWYAEHEDELEMHGYVRGPFGADNKMIYAGDMVTVDGIDHPVTVTRMYLFDDGWRIKLCGIDYTVAPSNCRQYRLPTVEDVLDEIVDRANHVGCAYMSNDMSGDEMMDALKAIIAEFAPRLRLADKED